MEINSSHQHLRNVKFECTNFGNSCQGEVYIIWETNTYNFGLFNWKQHLNTIFCYCVQRFLEWSLFHGLCAVLDMVFFTLALLWPFGSFLSQTKLFYSLCMISHQSCYASLFHEIYCSQIHAYIYCNFTESTASPHKFWTPPVYHGTLMFYNILLL